MINIKKGFNVIKSFIGPYLNYIIITIVLFITGYLSLKFYNLNDMINKRDLIIVNLNIKIIDVENKRIKVINKYNAMENKYNELSNNITKNEINELDVKFETLDDVVNKTILNMVNKIDLNSTIEVVKERKNASKNNIDSIYFMYKKITSDEL